MCIYTRQRELTFLGVYAKILIKNLTCFGFHFPLGFSRAYRMLVKLHFRHFPLQSPANNNGAPNGKRKAAQRVAMVNNILPRLFTSPLPLSLSPCPPLSHLFLCSVQYFILFYEPRGSCYWNLHLGLAWHFFHVAVAVADSVSVSVFFHVLLFAVF